MKRFDEAKPLLVDGYAAMAVEDIREQPPGPTFRRCLKNEAAGRIASLLDRQGHAEEAAAWRALGMRKPWLGGSLASRI